jgi:uncharacterized protein (DUF58 family)
MPLFDVFFSMLWFFLFVLWIWLLISVFSDILRDSELSGPAKASWLVALLLLPYLGVFIYLIVRGGSMQDRQVQRQAQAEQAVNTYIREVASAPSPAEELARLADLRDRGVLTDDEFAQQKARALAAS